MRSQVLLGFFFFFTAGAGAQSVAPVRVLTESSLDSLLTHRNGNALLLNIWATWCDPCKEEFPDLVKLSSAMQHRGLDVVAVSVDYPDEVATKIQPFIDTMRVPFPVYVADFPGQDEFFGRFDRRWSGAVPATFIYDAAGKQRRFLLGKQTSAQLHSAVEDVIR